MGDLNGTKSLGGGGGYIWTLQPPQKTAPKFEVKSLVLNMLRNVFSSLNNKRTMPENNGTSNLFRHRYQL